MRLESDFGESRLAKDANNLFAIKWTGKQKLDWPAIGYTVRKEGKFCVYKNRFDSFRHHSLRLSSNRYKHARNTNYKASAKALQKAHYAEDNAYAKKLINVINYYGYCR